MARSTQIHTKSNRKTHTVRPVLDNVTSTVVKNHRSARQKKRKCRNNTSVRFFFFFYSNTALSPKTLVSDIVREEGENGNFPTKSLANSHNFGLGFCVHSGCIFPPKNRFFDISTADELIH